MIVHVNVNKEAIRRLVKLETPKANWLRELEGVQPLLFQVLEKVAGGLSVDEYGGVNIDLSLKKIRPA